MTTMMTILKSVCGYNCTCSYICISCYQEDNYNEDDFEEDIEEEESESETDDVIVRSPRRRTLTLHYGLLVST